MVVSLVRTAIQTKCRYDNARMTGNYECAYALGILTSQEGVEPEGTITELKSVYDKVISGISAIQTAEGALNEAHSILQRMNELATQSANDTNTTADRTAVQSEVNALTNELSRIASTSQFNTQNLLDGTFTGKNLQVGALENQKITISIGTMNAKALGVDSLDVKSFTKAGSAMTLIQKAISKVSGQRSDLGALQNRLEHTVNNLDNISENTQTAESRIRDTDMASEMVQYSATSIIQQAGQSMLAQANSQTQGVLSLIQ